MTTPDRIHWCTGSDEEWTELTDALVATGTFTRLDPAKKPNSFHAASDPTDVARVEDRTYICSRRREGRRAHQQLDGPRRDEGHHARALRRLHEGPDDVRHPVRDGPPRGREADVRRRDHRLGLRHRLDARDGPHGHPRAAPDGGARRRPFVPAPALGRHAARADGQADVAWPCNDTKYIVQFPEERAIWSFGSGYGGNALLGKKCYALRIASVMARDEGWLAEHMLILKLTTPAGRHQVRRRGLPERLRQDQPRHARADHPGLEGRVHRRRHRLDADRRGRPAVGGQPGVRLLRRRARAPTSTPTPTRCSTINKGNSVFTNVALTEDGDIWWEGLENTAGPRHLLEGRALDARQRGAVQPPEQPLLHADQAVPDPRRRSTTTRAASRSTRSSSAAVARRRSRW